MKTIKMCKYILNKIYSLNSMSLEKRFLSYLAFPKKYDRSINIRSLIITNSGENNYTKMFVLQNVTEKVGIAKILNYI